MQTIAIASAKGGTGKSAVAVHLAVGLARRKKRVLVVDLDFQANATKWLLKLRERPPGTAPGVSGALEGKGVAMVPSPLDEHLLVCPATDALPGSEYAIAHKPAGQTNLRNALRAVAERFDYCIIDCAPNLGVAVVSGLCAADAVFVPIPTNFLGLSGLSDLEEAIKLLREGYRVKTEVRGYVLFGVDPRKSLASATRELLQEHSGGKLMGAEIRVSTAAERLPELHLTAWDKGADSRGAEDYAALLDEVLERMRKRKGKR